MTAKGMFFDTYIKKLYEFILDFRALTNTGTVS